MTAIEVKHWLTEHRARAEQDHIKAGKDVKSPETTTAVAAYVQSTYTLGAFDKIAELLADFDKRFGG